MRHPVYRVHFSVDMGLHWERDNIHVIPVLRVHQPKRRLINWISKKLLNSELRPPLAARNEIYFDAIRSTPVRVNVFLTEHIPAREIVPIGYYLLRGEESGLTALPAPDRIERMRQEMQAYYTERLRENQTRSVKTPQEIGELTARIERLRERLTQGDPDMTADEIEAAIERADGRLSELKAAQPAMRESAKVVSLLPRAAELYRRQLALGLDGDMRAALKVRIFLREWFSGAIRLEPLPDGGLMAHWNQNVTALLRGAERVVAGA